MQVPTALAAGKPMYASREQSKMMGVLECFLLAHLEHRKGKASDSIFITSEELKRQKSTCS